MERPERFDSSILRLYCKFFLSVLFMRQMELQRAAQFHGAVHAVLNGKDSNSLTFTRSVESKAAP